MIILEQFNKRKIKTAVFDFDGTISTLRCGWETIMEPLMVDIIYGGSCSDSERAGIRKFISDSTGIQTILQMKWICERVEAIGKTAKSPWEYKDEYNRRLIEMIQNRLKAAECGRADEYLMKGSKEFLKALKARNVRIFAASGTDDIDVKREAQILGIADLFDDIVGAMPYSEECSKEATLKDLISCENRDGLLVVGDGPVEIRLGREYGAITLGIAGQEVERSGFDEVKCARLRKAGAHFICDSFENKDEIFELLEG